MGKKPNYKLRRIIARIIIALIIIIPILIINRVKIARIPMYFTYKEYKETMNTFFEANYTNEETKQIMDELISKKLIKKVKNDYIIELNSRGYSNDTINYLITHLTTTEIKTLLNKKHDKDLEEYIKLDMFDYSKYDRYLDFQKKNKGFTKQRTIYMIELKVDETDYYDSVEEKDPDSLTALVNKHSYVSDSYEPSDLVDMEDDYSNNYYGVNRLRKEAYENFKEMIDAAKKSGYTIFADTTYRSYDRQQQVYINYAYEHTEEEVAKNAARAGYSEHELGTAIDVSNGWLIEEGDPEYKWLEQNAYKYGFIIRYKSKFENITKYATEGWHIRYVGKEAAETIYKKNITFDEYWLLYVKDKNTKKK